MTTDYDPIAEQYKRSKQQPWRTFIECHTLINLIGDLREISVLDVACGEGFYTRLLRQRGARRVTGVDLSAGMIELARAQEACAPLGIEYFVGDAREFQTSSPCDLVVAAYLLNYACTPVELQAMCQGVSRSLRPGGRFITVNCSPLLHFPSAPSYRQYGFEVRADGEWNEGTPIRWTFWLNDGPFEIENYHLDAAAHDSALRGAGFREVHWHVPQLAPEGVQVFASDYWERFLQDPPIAFIECVK
jgi:SAM-dependent methyltransferase